MSSNNSFAMIYYFKFQINFLLTKGLGLLMGIK